MLFNFAGSSSVLARVAGVVATIDDFVRGDHSEASTVLIEPASAERVDEADESA